MSLNLCTTQELVDQSIANLESSLNQTVPDNEKSFLRVLAVLTALQLMGLYKYGDERAKQVLALTASGTDLDTIGEEYDVIRKLAVATVLNLTLTGTDGTIIPATSTWTGAANGLTYYITSSATIVSGEATVEATCEDTGADGNLVATDTLSIVTPIAGLDATATVATVEDTGAEEESDDEYRVRVLFAERSTPGGNNATDYKTWAEETEGVVTAFPYSGKPESLGLTSYPGDRTIYVQADTDIDADGIAPTSLLDDVREMLTTDPDTEATRPCLGLTDDTLYVESITRSEALVQVTGLSTPSGQTTTVQSAIEEALETYFLAVVPYIDGVDISQDRNDSITVPSISAIIQDILDANASSASAVQYNIESTGYVSEGIYTLGQGELMKLIGVVYVD